MKHTDSMKKEFELSDRYDKGDRTENGQEEANIMKAYDVIRDGFHSHRVPVFNEEEIVNRMAREMKKGRGWHFPVMPVLKPFLKPSLAYFLIGIVLVFNIYHWLPAPVDRFQMVSGSIDSGKTLSWLWKQRMQIGKYVTTPQNTFVNLALADGSILSCSPETQLAIRFDEKREIYIRKGAIRVHAEHIPGSTMTVHTPLLDISVIGTVFHIELDH